VVRLVECRAQPLQHLRQRGDRIAWSERTAITRQSGHQNDQVGLGHTGQSGQGTTRALAPDPSALSSIVPIVPITTVMVAMTPTLARPVVARRWRPVVHRCRAVVRRRGWTVVRRRRTIVRRRSRLVVGWCRARVDGCWLVVDRAGLGDADRHAGSTDAD